MKKIIILAISLLFLQIALFAQFSKTDVDIDRWRMGGNLGVALPEYRQEILSTGFNFTFVDIAFYVNKNTIQFGPCIDWSGQGFNVDKGNLATFYAKLIKSKDHSISSIDIYLEGDSDGEDVIVASNGQAMIGVSGKYTLNSRMSFYLDALIGSGSYVISKYRGEANLTYKNINTPDKTIFINQQSESYAGVGYKFRGGFIFKLSNFFGIGIQGAYSTTDIKSDDDITAFVDAKNNASINLSFLFAW